MEYRQFPNSGLRVSVAGLGCNNFGARIDPEQSHEVMTAALDAGITFFDTAPSYGDGQSEEILGKELVGHRDGVIIATKFGVQPGSVLPGGARWYLLESVEKSLRRLQTDHIDLLQIHFPDRTTPIAETLATLDTLVEQGKVRYVGCSNFTGWMIVDASWVAKTNHYAPFISAQNHWSLLERAIEVEVTEAAERFSMSILPYFPLGSGLLTGKVRRGEAPGAETRLARQQFARFITDANLTKVESLARWADAHDISLTELALSWLASHEVVGSVIAGATQAAQVVANVAATKTTMTSEEIREVGELVGM